MRPFLTAKSIAAALLFAMTCAPGQGGNQHGEYTGQENAVKCAGTPDRRNRRTKFAEFPQVEQVGTDEDTDAAADIR